MSGENTLSEGGKQDGNDEHSSISDSLNNDLTDLAAGISALSLSDDGKDSEDEGATTDEAKSTTEGILKDMSKDREGAKPKTTGVKKQVVTDMQVLDQLTLDGIVDYIKKGSAKNIVTMVGAGISTAAGIPDFRTPGTGLYDNLKKYDLPYSQAIFELEYFKSNPEPFFILAKELIPGSAQPTKAHYFIKLLLQEKLLLRHYTQNIDNLERQAGIPEEYLVEAHGTHYYSHCLDCRKEYSFEWLSRELDVRVVPKCEDCSGIVKPDIVFFGEHLPDKFFENIGSDFEKCDLLIIMGSSLAVEPFASLCRRVGLKCPRLLVNNQEVGQEHGLLYQSPKNFRDVAWIGDCDTFCEIFTEKLGWKDKLDELLNERKPKKT